MINIVLKLFGSCEGDVIQTVKNVITVGLLWLPLIPKALSMMNVTIRARSNAMKKASQLCQAGYRKVFDPTNDVTMNDVLLFTLGCGAAFPLPKSFS